MGGYKGLLDGVSNQALQDQITALGTTVTSHTSALSNKADSSAVFGAGQTWQDVTASRVAGTTYTNNTGKPIAVSVYANQASTSNVAITLEINGLAVAFGYVNSASNNPRQTVSGVIPNGATYKVTISIGSLEKWHELR